MSDNQNKVLVVGGSRHPGKSVLAKLLSSLPMNTAALMQGVVNLFTTSRWAEPTTRQLRSGYATDALLSRGERHRNHPDFIKNLMKKFPN